MEEMPFLGQQDQPLEILILIMFVGFIIKSFWAYLDKKLKYAHVLEVERIKRGKLNDASWQSLDSSLGHLKTTTEDKLEQIHSELDEIKKRLERIESIVDRIKLVKHTDPKA
jgi:ppGpp synthetase/RelA/SpoT-type nucleotidyltranferase